MAQNLAEQLIRRLATDTAFRDALRALDPVGRRVFLDANGFQGVSPEWIQSVAHTTFKALTSGKSGVAEADAIEAVTTAATYAASIHGVATHGAHGIAAHGTHGIATHGAHGVATHGAHGVATHGTHGIATHGAHGVAIHGVATHGAVTHGLAAPTAPESGLPPEKDDSSKS